MEAFDPIALFRRSVAQGPHRAALECGGQTVSYAELDRWSDAVAEVLERAGLAAKRMAVLAEKRPATYAAILGILKCGGAYVPLAPGGPVARGRAMLDKAGVQGVFGLGPEDAFGEVRALEIPGKEQVAPPGTKEVLPGAEAYVLFTSGSTGGPKGVSVSRGNVAAYLRHQLSAYSFTPEDRFTQFFELTFDLSVHDLFVCWGAGGCLCVPDGHAALRAASFVRDRAITAWFSVPAVATVMQRLRSLTPGAMPSLRFAFFCGEALPWPLARAFRAAAPAARMVNLYGPTEATIAITAHEVPDAPAAQEGLVPIGLPFPGHAARLEQEELWLSGPQLARGYVRDPEATARAFVAGDPGGVRWYRTGDRVRQDPDGTLHFVGRIDHQVKVLGHRVEPAEVDALIAGLIGRGACATVPVEQGGSFRLVTFIDVPADEGILLGHCRAELPNYMVPERIISLPALPLTAHGKVDRKQLIALASHA